MRIPIYQVDAFTDKLFSGNPAAVCPLEKWLDDSVLQNIAAENNLSETAFFVEEGDHYHIRWMTPTNEVDLCGHATLASAFVIFNELDKSLDKIVFHSRSGELIVTRDGGLISLNFPSNKPAPRPRRGTFWTFSPSPLRKSCSTKHFSWFFGPRRRSGE